MVEIITTFLLGALIGSIFATVGVPAPVPPTVAGFMGIAGLFIGAFFVTVIKQ
jgi:XapX domain-containing protein